MRRIRGGWGGRGGPCEVGRGAGYLVESVVVRFSFLAEDLSFDDPPQASRLSFPGLSVAQTYDALADLFAEHPVVDRILQFARDSRPHPQHSRPPCILTNSLDITERPQPLLSAKSPIPTPVPPAKRQPDRVIRPKVIHGHHTRLGLAHAAREIHTALTEDARAEGVGRTIREVDRVVDGFGAHEKEDGGEELGLRDAHVGRDAAEERGGEV